MAAKKTPVAPGGATAAAPQVVTLDQAQLTKLVKELSGKQLLWKGIASSLGLLFVSIAGWALITVIGIGNDLTEVKTTVKGMPESIADKISGAVAASELRMVEKIGAGDLAIQDQIKRSATETNELILRALSDRTSPRGRN